MISDAEGLALAKSIHSIREGVMFAVKSILYPTDFSVEAWTAFEVACALASESGGRLVVLHVQPSPLYMLGGTAGVPPLPDEYDRDKLLEQLKSIRPAHAEIAVEHRLEYGEPAEGIIKAAEEIHANLIVMGTHGRTGLRRLLMGSVAERVVRTAPCPVLTVRNPATVPSALEVSP